MNTQATIAAACDLARNKYASAHVNAAQARLIAALIENPPPAFEIYPTVDQFEFAKEWALKIAAAMDDLISQVTVDAAGSATTSFSTFDRCFLVTEAVHDSGLISDLGEAAERLREDAREREVERV